MITSFQLEPTASTLPSPTLPCGIQANSMESMWIPHGFQVKCPKKEIFAPECMESILIPGSFHVESRKRFSVIICMEYMESMDSVWIPHGFQTILPKENVCAWNPGGLHGFQATLSKRKNPKKSKKILWPQVHKNYDIMLCQNEVSSISLVNNQWPLMYNACH